MPSLHTHPIPLHETPTPAHEHAWVTTSRHPTSDGIITYVRCTGCATRRVDLHVDPHLPPVALSHGIRSAEVTRR